MGCFRAESAPPASGTVYGGRAAAGSAALPDGHRAEGRDLVGKESLSVQIAYGAIDATLVCLSGARFWYGCDLVYACRWRHSGFPPFVRFEGQEAHI